MRVKIEKGQAHGTVCATPSKSAAHRALIAAALTGGVSNISGIGLCEDISATCDCLSALGAHITVNGGSARVAGTNGLLQSKNRLCCRESGSTLRFLLPLCLDGGEHTLYGSERLFERPLGIYEKLCAGRGIGFSRTASGVTVCGKLSGGDYTVPGNISSQFISGLLFALPLLAADSRITVIPPFESRPYVEMTCRCLSDFGVEITKTDDYTLSVRGGQHFLPHDTVIEGDWSNAAFLEAFNYLSGDVTVTGLDSGSVQGDKICLDYFGRLAAKDSAPIDIGDCPDLAPVLLCVAAVYGGGHFTGTGRLRIKESDRGAVMARELEKFGVLCTVRENDITVSGKLSKPEAALCGHNDHRVVMALSLLLTLTGGEILGAEAVSKSFPDFFKALKSLGIEVGENDS